MIESSDRCRRSGKQASRPRGRELKRWAREARRTETRFVQLVVFPGGIAVPERRKFAVSRHSRRRVLDKYALNASEEAK